MAHRYRRIHLFRKLRSAVLDGFFILLLGVLIGNGMLMLTDGPSDELFSQAEAASSFSVVNTRYDTTGEAPSRIKRVTFEVLAADGGAPQRAAIQLVSGSGDWYSCTSPDGLIWECSVPHIPVTQVNDFSVTLG